MALFDGLTNKNKQVKKVKKVTPDCVSSVSSEIIEIIAAIENVTYRKSNLCNPLNSG